MSKTRQCQLTNEVGYVFIVLRTPGDDLLAAYDRVETAIRAVEMSHEAELAWRPVPYGHPVEEAWSLATGHPIAKLHKVPKSMIPLALIL